MTRKPKDNRKAVATLLGRIELADGKKKFAFNSPGHYQHALNQFAIGQKLAVTFEEYKSTRSQAQLAYHWVLVGYIAEHSGHTKEEIHDTLLRAKFGTKVVKLGGIMERVRRSIANLARMPLSDCQELIDFDLRLCEELGIVVPSKQELGYLDD